MTITTLFAYIAVLALVSTWILYMAKAKNIRLLESFLQFFCGFLFVFSGWVKAIDPLGTAYKMEQYFDAFYATAAGSFLKFSAPLFPLMKTYAVGFSVAMIVLEIVLGIMLIIGYQRRLAAWLFFAILVFFTILTGFTYLTGYVPSDANFFEFSKWSSFNKNQMKVTDCGCFGDFMKLPPKVSFIKDLVLMVPAVWFLFRWKQFHELLTPSLRNSVVAFSLVGLWLFCLSNYKWNEPVVDFRPFANGVNIKTKLQQERKALSEIELIGYKLRHRESKVEVELPYAAYLDSFKANPNFKANWETLDQIKSEPKIPITKIADFEIMDLSGESVTDFLLSDSRYQFVILSPKVNYGVSQIEVEQIDSIFRLDTIKHSKKDSLLVRDVFVGLTKKMVKKNHYTWDPGFLQVVKNHFLPLIDSVSGPEVTAYFVLGGLTEEAMMDLSKQLATKHIFYQADEILIKTIMRSNPGLLLLKEGKIIYKWHHRRLPTIQELKGKYLNPAYSIIY